MTATPVTLGLRYLSPSGAGLLIRCPRRWWWSYVGGVKDGPTEATAMGSGFAEALEAGDLAAGIAAYRLHRPQLDPLLGDPEADELARQQAEAIITHAFRGYVQRWPDPVGTRREVTFILDMPDASRHLLVRADGVTDLFGIEDKLRSGAAMRAEAVANEAAQGLQLTAEAYCMWRESGQIRPVQLRCVKKPDPRKLRNNEAWGLEVRAHFERDDAYQEWTAHRTREQLESFEREFVRLSALADSVEVGSEPSGWRNLEVCHSFGRSCPALGHCQGAQSVSEILSFNRRDS